MEQHEINKLIEENDRLQKENESMKTLLKYEFESAYSSFVRGSINHFEIPDLDSYEKFMCISSIFKEILKNNSNSYRAKIVESRFLRTLLYSTKYQASEIADFDAKYAVEYFERSKNELSKKDVATLMRHIKIDTETYIDNLPLFSPYFHTLKKLNPELKDESVKLMNEVAGTKKKTVTRQEKLERRQGMLYAWKDYTPKEMSEYADSFDWGRMLNYYFSREDMDSLGRIDSINEELVSKLYESGYLNSCMLHYFNWHMHSFSSSVNTENIAKNSINYILEKIPLYYCGNVPVNELYPPFGLAFEKLFSESFAKAIASNNGYKERIWDIYAKYSAGTHYTQLPKILLNVDESKFSDYRKNLKNMISTLVYTEGLLKRSSYIREYVINYANESTSYSWSTMAAYRSNISRCDLFPYIKGIETECENKINNLMEIINRVMDNPKTKEYINSDKYWTGFCTPEKNSEGQIIRSMFTCGIKNSVGSLAIITPELWKSLEAFINIS